MQPTREDILIGRVTDGEATPADWQELETLAIAEAGVWTRLAAAQRAHADLARAVDDELTVAELVHAPAHEAARGGMTLVSQRWRAYSGWAAAAALALAWAGANGLNLRIPGAAVPGTNAAGLFTSGPDDLFTQYLDKGKAQGSVLGELPKVMIETIPVADAKPGEANVEVVYVRRVLERAMVNNVYRVSRDEHGNPVPLQVNVSNLRGGRPL
jgi:hypothetical protein